MQVAEFVFNSEECVICMDGASSQVFKSCNHCCTCEGCSKQITSAGLDCPLCRSKIDRCVPFGGAGAGGVGGAQNVVPVLGDELNNFAQRKDEYVSQLKRACAKNAGFTGNSKLARGVAREVGSEMEQRELERKGSDRCMTKKVDFVVSDANLEVSYKVGRKTVVENYLFMDWATAKSSFVELIAGDTISVLDMSIFYPEYYWIFRHHVKNVEDALVECGLIQNKRQRK